MTKTIGQLLFDYTEARNDYQALCQEIIARAKELGLDKNSAEDVRISIAYLNGYRKRGDL